ncbi:hypothetical protein A374_15993 [Fictibacillus macauensis ZFHKF-1]|uniref:DUF3147 family protein n=1 Tax=Fictibacillus macauensis ZFHKF-1 TaxID=1196324 RepID=I8UBY3_9BACL|nr:hypothetical protein [Fictibacillus macauensis]EIT84303.1 hypothetical protein A374_15993 [Fictibacillus macauensis ZFHKF-1]
MFIVLKILVSAFVIAFVTELASKNQTLGGLLAALPLVSILSLLWLAKEGMSTNGLREFLRNVMYGLPVTFVILLAIWLALRYVSVSMALVIGVLCGSCYVIVHRLFNVA